MPRLKDVLIPEAPQNRPTKTLTIDAHTANLLRRVARSDGLRLSAFLDRALRAYLEKHHPSWPLVEDDPARALQTVDVTTQSLSELASTHGVHAATLRSRVQRGIPLEQAIDRRLLSEPARYPVHGELLTASEVSNKYGINASKFRYRVKQGVPPDEAILPGRMRPRRTG